MVEGLERGERADEIWERRSWILCGARLLISTEVVGRYCRYQYHYRRTLGCHCDECLGRPEEDELFQVVVREECLREIQQKWIYLGCKEEDWDIFFQLLAFDLPHY